MAGPFYHHLHVLFPRLFGQTTNGFQLAELGRIVGIVAAAGTQAVAERKGGIVLRHQLANLIKMFVEKTLFFMRCAPLGHNRTAARNNAGEPLGRKGQMFAQQSGMNRKIIHTLLALFHQGIAKNFPRQVFGHAVHLFQGLIDGHGSHRHRTVANNPFARFVNMRPRR